VSFFLVGRLLIRRSFLLGISPENIHYKVSDIFTEGQTLGGGYDAEVIVLVALEDNRDLFPLTEAFWSAHG